MFLIYKTKNTVMPAC